MHCNLMPNSYRRVSWAIWGHESIAKFGAVLTFTRSARQIVPPAGLGEEKFHGMCLMAGNTAIVG